MALERGEWRTNTFQSGAVPIRVCHSPPSEPFENSLLSWIPFVISSTFSDLHGSTFGIDVLLKATSTDEHAPRGALMVLQEELKRKSETLLVNPDERQPPVLVMRSLGLADTAPAGVPCLFYHASKVVRGADFLCVEVIQSGPIRGRKDNNLTTRSCERDNRCRLLHMIVFPMAGACHSGDNWDICSFFNIDTDVRLARGCKRLREPDFCSRIPRVARAQQ